MNNELPWFKFNVSEWLGGDIQMCAPEAKGIAIDLFAQLWKKGGTLPDDPEYLARLLRVHPDPCSKALAMLKQCYILLETGSGEVYVEFITEQLADMEDTHKRMVAAGRKGGKAKALRRPKQSSSKAVAKVEQSSSKALAIKNKSKDKEKDKEYIDARILAGFLLEEVGKTSVKSMTSSVASSTKPIQRLMKKGVTAPEIREAISWLCGENMDNGKYSMVVESGNTLLSKWDRIVLGMNRSKKNGTSKKGRKNDEYDEPDTGIRDI